MVDVYPGDFPNPDPNPADVKLGGCQQLVRGDVFRGKFRNSFEKPEPFEPGKVTKIEFTMPDVCHSFRRGHRLIVHVQSSWFPKSVETFNTSIRIFPNSVTNSLLLHLKLKEPFKAEPGAEKAPQVKF